MTLKQAYKMRREENLSLLRENKRLKKQLNGVFPVEEKEALERKVRHLEQVIKTGEKRYDSLREHCRIAENRCYDLDLEINPVRGGLWVLYKDRNRNSPSADAYMKNGRCLLCTSHW